jgi:hypothetical protein
MLRDFLNAEVERNAPKHEIRGPIKEFEGSIRKSRVPWSRKQAELEEKFARKAAKIEREAWEERVRQADKVDNANKSSTTES